MTTLLENLTNTLNKCNEDLVPTSYANATGAYVAVNVPVTYFYECYNRLVEFGKDKIPPSPIFEHYDKPHITLMYDSTSAKELAEDAYDNVVINYMPMATLEAKVKEFKVLTNGDEKSMVALLESDSLNHMHELYKDAGLTHSFEEYLPHITLFQNDPTNGSLFPPVETDPFLGEANNSLEKRPITVRFDKDHIIEECS